MYLNVFILTKINILVDRFIISIGRYLTHPTGVHQSYQAYKPKFQNVYARFNVKTV